jgi:hypothetical protein
MTWEDKFGRWIEHNEIVIEDLTEQQELYVAEKMALIGYNLEYWKAPLQKSGHLHIKNIIFPEELTEEELKEYKKAIIEKYMPFGVAPDMQLIGTHRIAEENKEHYKGYGIKTLITEWNKGSVNYAEQDVYLQIKKLVAKRNGERVILAEGTGITAKLVAAFKITDLAKQFGFKPDKMGRCECLLHGGSNPTSLKLNDETGTFCCFSCGLKGNIVDFVYEAQKLGLKRKVENGENKDN